MSRKIRKLQKMNYLEKGHIEIDRMKIPFPNGLLLSLVKFRELTNHGWRYLDRYFDWTEVAVFNKNDEFVELDYYDTQLIKDNKLYKLVNNLSELEDVPDDLEKLPFEIDSED